jgi:hypothetical protein
MSNVWPAAVSGLAAGGRPQHPRAVDADVTGGVGDQEEDRGGRRGDAPRYRDPVR